MSNIDSEIEKWRNPLYTVRLKIGCGNSTIKNGT